MKHKHFALGFDIGTKNLAYCLSSYTNKFQNKNNQDNQDNQDNHDKKNNKEKIDLSYFNVIDSGIINIHKVKLYCKQIKNKRAICNKQCLDYVLKDESEGHDNINNIEGYCKTHAKKLRENNNKAKKEITRLLKLNNKKQNNKKQENITESDKENIKKIEEENRRKIRYDISVEQYKIKNVYKTKNNKLFGDTLNLTTEKLLEKLEELFLKIRLGYDYNVNTQKISKIKDLVVVVENQPTKRIAMNNISMILYTFFQMKKKEYPKIIKKVKFTHAVSKTSKLFVTDIYHTFGIKSSIKKFILYGKRKEFSEDIVKKLYYKISLNSSKTLSSFVNFMALKKKDDVADALLFTVYEFFYYIE